MRKIIYIQYTNPEAYPPLEHSSRLLAQDGWQVMFLGTRGTGVDILRFPPHSRIKVRRISFCPGGWRQKLHYVYFVLWVASWTLRWRSHWVYASDPLSCPAALILSFLPNVRIVYHEHDSPNTTSQVTTRYSRFMRFVLWTRCRLTGRAAFCILPNEQRMQRFVQEMNSRMKVLCVWNCPRLEEVKLARPCRNSLRLIVYYHGNVSPSYVPISVLKAIHTLSSNISLRIVGHEAPGAKGYINCLKAEAKRLNITVDFLGAMPRYKVMERCCECDVGLVFTPRNDRDINNLYRTGASNKPFDYLACGLAVLVSDLPEWRQMYVETGYGLACDPDDPETIAAALRWFLRHPTEMRQMGERGRQKIATEWNYEMQFGKVYQTLRDRG